MTQAPSTNKELAQNFLHMVSTGKVDEAFAEMVGQDFVHHNAWSPEGRDGLRGAMLQAAQKAPGQTLRVFQTIAEGDRVVTHSLVIPAEGHPCIVVVHIFRFVENLIAEFWDVAMPVPEGFNGSAEVLF